MTVWPVTQGELSWKRGSEWDKKLSFGGGRREGLGLQAKLSEESLGRHWERWGKRGH